MARHPEWFQRLDAILEVVARTELDWLGRGEIQAIFGVSERDSVRLLHKFGAAERDNLLSLPRPALAAQLDAIRYGARYSAYLGARRGVAQRLTAARSEAEARQFRVSEAAVSTPAGLDGLPETIEWRRGHFAIRYRDGADLMEQLAAFLAAAGAEREEFLAGTEPGGDG